MGDKNESGKSGFYETFDSGSSPTIPENEKADFAKNDSGAALEKNNDQHLKVPTIPQK